MKKILLISFCALVGCKESDSGSVASTLPVTTTPGTSTSIIPSRYDVWRPYLKSLTNLKIDNAVTYPVTDIPSTTGQLPDEDVNWASQQFKDNKFVKLTAPGPKGVTSWYTETSFKNYYWVITKTDSTSVNLDRLPQLAIDANGVYGFDGNPNGGAHFTLKR